MLSEVMYNCYCEKVIGNKNIGWQPFLTLLRLAN